MSTRNCFKYEFFGSGNSDLLNIFTNNSNTVNSILPFGLHINGGVSVCVTKCGHTLSSCDDIQIETVINYGKILVMTPKNKNSEINLHYDARNENANPDGSGTYKLKFICFTCPSTIKIGDIDSDMQSYLVYTNSQGHYCVLCTLYRNNQPYDNLANSLLSGLINNNIPNRGGRTTGSSLGVSSINLSDFFPQDKQDYYEFINTEKSSNEIKNNILVKVFAKKVNISSVPINNLKEKLFDKSSNCKFFSFNESLESTFVVKPENLNIFHVPDLGISKTCGMREKMENIEKNIEKSEEIDEETEEEEITLIEKITKANLEDKKEKYINFDKIQKIYAINVKDGSVKKIGSNDEKDEVYNGLQELMVKNPDYDEDEIKRAINEFPNYSYQNSHWCFEYKVRLYKVEKKDDTSSEDSYFKIIDVDNLNDAVTKIGITDDSDPDQPRKDVFYAMKNFPNVPVKDYYVSYYYKSANHESPYLVVMYLILCAIILLFNFIFYRIIYFVTNKSFGDMSLDDDEIITDDNLKQLAAWRLLNNIILIIQIFSTIIFCILKLSNLKHNIKTFSNSFIILTIISLGTTLGYGFLRLYHNDPKISFAESKSLKLL